MKKLNKGKVREIKLFTFSILYAKNCIKFLRAWNKLSNKDIANILNRVKSIGCTKGIRDKKAGMNL